MRPPKGAAFHIELFPLHSPLLGESLLVSFPPLNNMLKFGGSSCLSSALSRSYWLWVGACVLPKLINLAKITIKLPERVERSKPHRHGGPLLTWSDARGGARNAQTPL